MSEDTPYVIVTYNQGAEVVEKRYDDIDIEQTVSEFISDLALDFDLPAGDLYILYNSCKVPLGLTLQDANIYGAGEKISLHIENIPA